MIRRVCIQWPRFGPYHIARLRAACALFSVNDVDLYALETAGTDRLYDWEVELDSPGFHHTRLFPDERFEDISPGVMHAQVISAMNEIQPDVIAINSYSYPDARACLEWCRRNRKIAVVMTDSKQDDAPRITWREHIKSILLDQFDAALLAGTPHRAYFEQLGFPPDAIFLGYDVVDNDFFGWKAHEARQNRTRLSHLPGLEDSTPFFLSVNRFLPRKNLNRLLEAYRIYRERSDQAWRMILIGDGPERIPLEQFIRTHELDGVVLTGALQIEEIAGYYGLAGVFIHPTIMDTWGLVVNEAMAAGLPVLVSERAGCAQDLVSDDVNGFRFDPYSPEQLAHLMVRLSTRQDERLSMGKKSEEIIARWSPTFFAEQLWHAACYGSERADRIFRPLPRFLLKTIRLAARDARSFHTVPD